MSNTEPEINSLRQSIKYDVDRLAAMKRVQGVRGIQEPNCDVVRLEYQDKPTGPRPPKTQIVWALRDKSNPGQWLTVKPWARAQVQALTWPQVVRILYAQNRTPVRVVFYNESEGDTFIEMEDSSARND